jgi:hypothetical protein
LTPLILSSQTCIQLQLLATARHSRKFYMDPLTAGQAPGSSTQGLSGKMGLKYAISPPRICYGGQGCHNVIPPRSKRQDRSSSLWQLAALVLCLSPSLTLDMDGIFFTLPGSAPAIP